MDSITIFWQMTVLFAMMALGYASYKKDVINDNMATGLSKLVVNIFNPILIVNSVLGEGEGIPFELLMQNLKLVLLYYVCLVIFGYVIVLLLKPARDEKAMYLLMATFSNVGYLCIPLVQTIYGNEAVLLLAFYILGFNILFYTYGVIVAGHIKHGAEQSKSQTAAGNLLKQLANPGGIACAIALYISVTRISIPRPFASFCEYMGSATIPISMMMIGVSFAQAGLKETFRDWRAYVFTLLRVIVLPVIVYYMTKHFVFDEVVYGVFILELSMPVGSIVTMIVQEQGGDTTCCMRGTVFSTLVTIVSIPLVFFLTIG